MFRNLSTDALGFWAPQNEQIELALSFGFKSIDLDIVDFGEQVESRTLPKARRLIDSAKIKLGAFRLPVRLEADDEAFAQALQKLRGQAQLAHDVQCSRAIVTLAPASDTRPMHEDFELHRARLSEIAAVLEGSQIRLGVGFDATPAHREGKEFEFIHDFDTLSKLVDAVGRPNVGFVIDPWHLHVGGSSPDVARQLPAERIVYVRLANAPPDKPAANLKDEDRLPPGTKGAIDLAGLVRALKEKDYRGPLTPVPSFGSYHGKRRDQAIRLMAEALDETCVAAGLPRAIKPRSVSESPPSQQDKRPAAAPV